MVEFDKNYGPAAPELGWVPAPSYLARRQAILDVLQTLPPGRVLEVGCGAGALVYELQDRGFDCTALETSERARELARAIHGDAREVEFYGERQNDWQGSFDYLLSFEVLEHIEHDADALREWKLWLAPGGRLICSVPAHRRRWSASDVWAGHFRRYEREDLVHLLTECGFAIESVQNYGFPVSNIIAPIRALYHRRKMQRQKDLDRAECTARSGNERNLEVSLYRIQKSIFVRLFLRACFMVQKWCRNRELGPGLFAVARVADETQVESRVCMTSEEQALI